MNQENNERKSKKFSYITLPNGQKKRTGLIFSQTGGGRTTEEIDNAFDSETERMSYDEDTELRSWYSHLNIEPANFVEKCISKGIMDDNTVEFVETWGGNSLHTTDPPVKYADFIKRNKLERGEDSLKKYEDEILNGSYKTAQRGLYENCVVDLTKTAALCSRLIERHKIRNESDISNVEGLTEQEKIQVLYCIKNGHGYNGVDRDYPDSYEPELFTHIRNGGSGDCLFIAFANYLHLVKLNRGVYPDPLNNSGNGNIEYDINRRQRDDTETAAKMRKQVVDFIKANKDKTMVGNGQSLKLNIAFAAIDRRVPVVKEDDFKKIIADFKSSYSASARALGLNSHNVTYAQIQTALNIDKPDDVNILVEMILNKYLQNIANRSTFGGQIEITCLASIYNVDIRVLQMNNNKLTSNMGQPVQDPQGVVYLYHTQSVNSRIGGLHFECMFPLPRKNFTGTSIKKIEDKKEIATFISAVEKGVELAHEFSILQCFEQFLKSEQDKTKEEALTLLWSNEDFFFYKDDAAIYNFTETVIMSCQERYRHSCLRTLLNFIIESQKKNNHINVFINCLNNDKQIKQHRKNIESMIKETDGSPYNQIKTTLLNYFSLHDGEIDRDELHGLDILELFYIVKDLEETENTVQITSYFILGFFDLIFINTLNNIDNLKEQLSIQEIHALFKTLPIIDKQLTLDNIIDFVELYGRIFTFYDEDDENEQDSEQQETQSEEDSQEEEELNMAIVQSRSIGIQPQNSVQEDSEEDQDEQDQDEEDQDEEDQDEEDQDEEDYTYEG